MPGRERREASHQCEKKAGAQKVIDSFQGRLLPKPEATKEDKMRNSILNPLLGAVVLSLMISIGTANGDEFVMPVTGDLFLQQMGGEAGGVTSFGLGTSPTNFTPFYTGLPNNPNPTGEVLVGMFNSGTTIHFGEFTVFGSLSGFAFSNGTDQASLVAFTDVDNSLGMGGSIIQRTGPQTWLLHLDDAESFRVDDDDNDVLMQVRVAPVPELTTLLSLPSGILVLAYFRKRLKVFVQSRI